jgi:N4-gp56 family major capsid protein
MSTQTFALTAGRINKFKGEILKHAKPYEVLSKVGRQVQMPQNNSDTYVARRFLPYGATSSQPNIFFPTATGDRGNTIVQAHLTQEGVTPTPDSITPVDITEVVNQYSCLYGFTDKTFNLYEDDIPEQMKIQIGERVGLVNEMIVYGKLKSCTNQFYGGSGTSRTTVAGPMTLNLQSAVVRSLMANHAMPVTRVLSASPKYDTSAVAPGYFAYTHSDLERQIRDLPNFVPAEKYASGTPEEGEIGKCERFRYILSPDLPSFQDAGAAIASWAGSGTGYSTTGSNLDVYPIIVMGADAFSQIAVRGLSALDPTFLPPGEKSKSDPLGQRGYAGTSWWKACMIENPLWMAVVNVARQS